MSSSRILSFIKKNLSYIIFLAIIVLTVYANGLNNDFLSDDILSIPQNPNIGNWQYIVSHPLGVGRAIPYFLINKIGGLNPFFYRLFNLVLHISNVWLIFILVYILYNARVAFFAATLFSVHPVLVESVTWISGGPYAQYSFFFLLSLIFYILFDREKTKKYYFLSLLAFILSLISNRNAVVLPFILVIYDLSQKRGLTRIKLYIPYFALSVFWFYLFLGSLRERVAAISNTFYQSPGIDNPLVQVPIAIFSYFVLIFFPYELTLYHSELAFGPIRYLSAVVITLIYLISVIYFYKKNRMVFFWLVFFVIPLLPTLTPFRIAWIVAERYAYLSTLGLIVIAALVFTRFDDNKSIQKVSRMIFITIILLFAMRVITRNIEWKNDVNLWTVTGKTSPSSPWTHNNLGDLYGRHGDLKGAAVEFKKAIQLLPNYADAYHNLGNTYRDMKQPNEALANYQMAIKYNPSIWQSYLNIAAIYFSQGKADLAKSNIEKAISLNPADSSLHSNLGVIFLSLGRKEEAKKEFIKALQINPNNSRAKAELSKLGG